MQEIMDQIKSTEENISNTLGQMEKKMVWMWRSMNYDQISIKEKKHPIVNNPKNSQNRIWS